MNLMDLSDFLDQPKPGVLELGGARMALLDIESGFWGIRRQVEALIGPRLTNSVFQQAGANGGASFAGSFVPTIDQSLAGGGCPFTVASFSILETECKMGHSLKAFWFAFGRTKYRVSVHRLCQHG